MRRTHMSCFGSRFLLAEPVGCKVAGCAQPHPFAQVYQLMIFCLPQATQRKRVDIVDENLSTRYTEDGCGVLVRQRTTTTRSLATE